LEKKKKKKKTENGKMEDRKEIIKK